MADAVGGWIPTSNSQFSFSDIRKQWGYSNNDGSISMNSYYRNGGLVPNTTLPGSSGQYSNIPTSGSIGMNQFVNHKIARIIRKNHQYPTNDNNRETYNVQYQALYLDLSGWSTSQTVNVRFEQQCNNSGHFISMSLFGPVNNSGTSRPYTQGYAIRGESNTGSRDFGGYELAHHHENQSSLNVNLKGGYYYMWRSADYSSNSSGIYCGGEDQGGGAGVATGQRFWLTVHDNGTCCGDNNQGGNADFAARFYITGSS